VNYIGEYNTDLVKERALGFLEDAAQNDKPFFLGIAPMAPHAAVGESTDFTTPEPAERHKDLFQGVNAPRTSNWNPKEVNSPFFLSISLSCLRIPAK
jgi:N-acetylglucosamine-6-sulfatase